MTKSSENLPKSPRNAEQTKQALLEAALEAFATAGFAGARVDAIALRSGFNKSLIFQYFGDKEGLYRAVVEGLRQESDRGYREQVQPDQYLERPLDKARLREFLERSTRWIFSSWLSQPHHLGVLSWRMAEGSPLFDMDNLFQMPGTVVALQVLERAKKQGLIHSALEPRLITSTIMSLPLMYMRALPLLERSDPQMLGGVCEQVLVLLLEGLLARE